MNGLNQEDEKDLVKNVKNNVSQLYARRIMNKQTKQTLQENGPEMYCRRSSVVSSIVLSNVDYDFKQV